MIVRLGSPDLAQLARSVIQLLAGLAVSMWISPVVAQEDPSATIEKAQWLRDRGQGDQAQELLRRVAEQHPDVEAFAVARGQAYLADNNPFWALKVLGEQITRHPPACAARALAARVHIREANLEPAEQILEAPECSQNAETKLRFLLLRGEIAELRGDWRSARDSLLAAVEVRRRYEEDDQRLRRLLAQQDPSRQPALAVSLDLGAGWSSHGAGALPIDLPLGNRRSGSALVGMDLQTRWIPISGEMLRAVAEAELHLAQYLETPTKALSSRQPLLRVGLSLGRGKTRSYLAYATDWIFLDGGSSFPKDGFAHSSAHRFETRTQVAGGFMARTSVGYRSFWQSERNRRENEVGLSKTFDLSNQLRFTLGTSSRVYRAKQRAYDQFGATGLVGLDITMPLGFALHETLALSYDVFPRSTGYFGSATPRRDKSIRVGLALSSPEVLGLNFGLHYGYVDRASNATPYEFADHRTLLTATWQVDSDSLTVKRIPKAGRTPLPYPDDENPNGAKTKAEVIEVIRQDESQRRDSSCMK